MNYMRYRKKTAREMFGPSTSMRSSTGANFTTSHDQSLINTTHTSTSNRDTTVILAITQGRADAQFEIGIASIDLSSPELILCQFSDDPWLNGLLAKIQKCSATEIIIPETFCNYNPLEQSNLIGRVKANFGTIPIRQFPRRYFHSQDGLNMIKHSCSKKYQHRIEGISEKYYAISAAAALFHYININGKVRFIQNSLKMKYESKDGTLMLDIQTSHRLELLYPLCKTRQQKSCLYGILNRCVTLIGQRTLRAKLLEPDADYDKLNASYDAIAELSERADQLDSMSDILKKFKTIDKLLQITQVAQGTHDTVMEIMLNQTIQLKTALRNIPRLMDVLKEVKGVQFATLKNILENQQYVNMLKKIDAVLHPGVGSNSSQNQYFQRLHIIAENKNKLLDFARSNYMQLVDCIDESINSLRNEHNLCLKMHHTISRGFHIKLVLTKNKPIPLIPSIFEELSRNKSFIFLSTDEIKKINHRIWTVANEISKINFKMIQDLINNLIEDIDALYDLVGCIGMLDIILSYTTVSVYSNFCRPNFGEEMRITEAVHPLLEYSELQPNSVPNNVIATPEYNFFIITGPNMGGKTVYIKMICILQIMAQIGCYVSAKTAQFRLTDKIFARIGFDDNIKENMSSYVAEIHEMNFLIKTMTPNSLIVIDEIFRSTNPNEGVTIAWKMCERLIKSTETCKKNNETLRERNLLKFSFPFIFLTTHFQSLTALSDDYFNVINLNFSAEEVLVDREIHYTYPHEIREGPTTTKDYGLMLATKVHFPKSIIERAKEIKENLSIHNSMILKPRNNQPEHTSFTGVLTLNRTISSVIHRSSVVSSDLSSSANSETSLDKILYNLYGDISAMLRNSSNLSEQELNQALNDFLKSFLEEQSDSFKDTLQKAKSIRFAQNSSKYRTNTEIVPTATRMETINTGDDRPLTKTHKRFVFQNKESISFIYKDRSLNSSKVELSLKTTSADIDFARQISTAMNSTIFNNPSENFFGNYTNNHFYRKRPFQIAYPNDPRTSDQSFRNDLISSSNAIQPRNWTDSSENESLKLWPVNSQNSLTSPIFEDFQETINLNRKCEGVAFNENNSRKKTKAVSFANSGQSIKTDSSQMMNFENFFENRIDNTFSDSHFFHGNSAKPFPSFSTEPDFSDFILNDLSEISMESFKISKFNKNTESKVRKKSLISTNKFHTRTSEIPNRSFQSENAETTEYVIMNRGCVLSKKPNEEMIGLKKSKSKKTRHEHGNFSNECSSFRSDAIIIQPENNQNLYKYPNEETIHSRQNFIEKYRNSLGSLCSSTNGRSSYQNPHSAIGEVAFLPTDQNQRIDVTPSSSYISKYPQCSRSPRDIQNFQKSSKMNNNQNIHLESISIHLKKVDDPDSSVTGYGSGLDMSQSTVREKLANCTTNFNESITIQDRKTNRKFDQVNAELNVILPPPPEFC